MATYAKVAIESPLPQLDRLFDYLVPDGLQQQIAIGQRVRVPFGKAGKLLVGFVVELSFLDGLKKFERFPHTKIVSMVKY